MEHQNFDDRSQSANSHYNVCDVCGKTFTPSFRHPHQKYCAYLSCVRKRDAIRKKNNTKVLSKNSSYIYQTSKRKHKEYMRRKARKSQSPVLDEESIPPYLIATLRNLSIHFMGLIACTTGITDAVELNRIQKRCHDIGKNIYSGFFANHCEVKFNHCEVKT